METTSTGFDLDVEDNIRVLCRIRPDENESEIEQKNCLAIHETESSTVVLSGFMDPKFFTFDYIAPDSVTQDEIYETIGVNYVKWCLDGFNTTILCYGQTGTGKTYTLFGEDVANGQCFRLSSKLNKTSNMGLIPRMVQDICTFLDSVQQFNGSNTSDASSEQAYATCSIQFYEVYQEKVYDLLAENPNNTYIPSSNGINTNTGPGGLILGPGLKIRDDTQTGVYVEGCTTHPITNLTQGLQLIAKGCDRRTVGETRNNKRSSRSHAIMVLTVDTDYDMSTMGILDPEQLADTDGDTDETTGGMRYVRRARLTLVDLAGSESHKEGNSFYTFQSPSSSSTSSPGSQGGSSTGAFKAGKELAREGAYINRSLSILGTVIHNLSRGQRGTSKFVGYRDSKLTFLLRDALNLNTKTLLIATVSARDTALNETLSTLKFAQRAKSVPCVAVINSQTMTSSDPNLKLNSKLRVAENEISKLRASLLRCNCRTTLPPAIPVTPSPTPSPAAPSGEQLQELQQLRGRLQFVEAESRQREMDVQHQLELQRSNFEILNQRTEDLLTAYQLMEERNRELQAEVEALQTENSELLSTNKQVSSMLEYRRLVVESRDQEINQLRTAVAKASEEARHSLAQSGGRESDSKSVATSSSRQPAEKNRESEKLIGELTAELQQQKRQNEQTLAELHGLQGSYAALSTSLEQSNLLLAAKDEQIAALRSSLELKTAVATRDSETLTGRLSQLQMELAAVKNSNRPVSAPTALGPGPAVTPQATPSSLSSSLAGALSSNSTEAVVRDVPRDNVDIASSAPLNSIKSFFRSPLSSPTSASSAPSVPAARTSSTTSLPTLLPTTETGPPAVSTTAVTSVGASYPAATVDAGLGLQGLKGELEVLHEEARAWRQRMGPDVAKLSLSATPSLDPLLGLDPALSPAVPAPQTSSHQTASLSETRQTKDATRDVADSGVNSDYARAYADFLAHQTARLQLSAPPTDSSSQLQPVPASESTLSELLGLEPEDSLEDTSNLKSGVDDGTYSEYGEYPVTTDYSGDLTEDGVVPFDIPNRTRDSYYSGSAVRTRPLSGSDTGSMASGDREVEGEAEGDDGIYTDYGESEIPMDEMIRLAREREREAEQDQFILSDDDDGAGSEGSGRRNSGGGGSRGRGLLLPASMSLIVNNPNIVSSGSKGKAPGSSAGSASNSTKKTGLGLLASIESLMETEFPAPE